MCHQSFLREEKGNSLIFVVKEKKKGVYQPNEFPQTNETNSLFYLTPVAFVCCLLVVFVLFIYFFSLFGFLFVCMFVLEAISLCV